ncbi:MAG TPA: phosphoribosylformylglycinamidine cyclo-ligase [Syntrophobacteraceae bacterium]|nr:phosphoribosylformylglycinamidine cyclo-ligase [Syntrophobacteraceae bacterium]
MGAKFYRESGVDLDKANELVKRIQPLVRTTFHGGVIKDIGGFGAMYSLNCSELKNPVLVSSTDGVGTKLRVAAWADRHNTVGIDLVAMSVNDIIVQGARPLFFLDYLAMGRLNLDVVEQIVGGVVAGCKEANCPLIGGETAEMPGFYGEKEYDLAGFAVGLVENSDIIDGSSIHVGEVIIGLASTGLHSNGYSLVRRILLDRMGLKPDSFLEECNRSAAEELLAPTRIYVEPVLKVLKQFRISGMAHITGGGFYDNIPRILPRACRALIRKGSWEVPPIFRILQEKGEIPEEEMYHVFNNGIGYILVAEPEETDDLLGLFRAMGEKAYTIGEIVPREENGPPVQILP